MGESSANAEALPLLCTVVILAGGISSRFGADKANAVWRGRKLINHVAARLEGLRCETLAVARADQKGGDWRVDRLVHDDPALSGGPLCGVVRGLEECRTDWAFVIACDAPLVRPELVRELCRRASEADAACAAVLPIWEGVAQPLAGLYRVSIAPRLRAALAAGERSPARALRDLSVCHLPEPACRALDPRGLSFVNVNTPADLDAADSLFQCAD
ncbi:MAG: molybdenum cofactor guanylyltransferase [bacterium]|nr:molybdenum cofactor guanylyltransferase [bacterium]